KLKRALADHEPGIIRVLDKGHQGGRVNRLRGLQLTAQVNVLAEVLLSNRLTLGRQHQHVVGVLWDSAVFKGKQRRVYAELRDIVFGNTWAHGHDRADVFTPDIQRRQGGSVQVHLFYLLDAGF